MRLHFAFGFNGRRHWLSLDLGIKHHYMIIVVIIRATHDYQWLSRSVLELVVIVSEGVVPWRCSIEYRCGFIRISEAWRQVQ